jgi:putative membrane protein
VTLSFVVAACAGDNNPDTPRTTGTGGTVGTAGTPDADRGFVEDQLALGTAEIELGRLAQQRGQHADVKEFGAVMVEHHQKAADELRPIASQFTTGEAAAGTPDAGDHKDLMEELSSLSGRDFDRKYIQEMIDDHEEGIDDLEGKAENASSPEVKAWAAKTLPTMRQHLERARTIKETLDRAGESQ